MFGSCMPDEVLINRCVDLWFNSADFTMLEHNEGCHRTLVLPSFGCREVALKESVKTGEDTHFVGDYGAFLSPLSPASRIARMIASCAAFASGFGSVE